jgi:sugar phosphate isomerase/epimerase
MSRPSRRDFLKGSLSAAGFGATLAAAGPPTVQALFGPEKPAPMKYSMCNETFQDWPQGKIFRFLAECGYGGVEIAPFTINTDVTQVPPRQRTRLRQQAEAANIEIVALHWLLAKTEGLHLTSPHKQVRQKTATYLGELAKFCADLGGKVMVFGSPQQRNLAEGISPKQGMQYATEVLRAALPVLEKNGVVLALEPLAPTETNFLTTAAEALELARLVDSPRCKLLLDCKAMTTEPTPIPELIRKYGSWLVHFHANDPNLQGPGFGKLDFVPIFKALREVNFRGWVSVEVFDYTPGPERLARESIGYMRRCLAQVDRLDKPGKQGAP